MLCSKSMNMLFKAPSIISSLFLHLRYHTVFKWILISASSKFLIMPLLPTTHPAIFLYNVQVSMDLEIPQCKGFRETILTQALCYFFPKSCQSPMRQGRTSSPTCTQDVHSVIHLATLRPAYFNLQLSNWLPTNFIKFLSVFCYTFDIKLCDNEFHSFVEKINTAKFKCLSSFHLTVSLTILPFSSHTNNLKAFTETF